MYHKYSNGMIEIITGPMFSGKSEELIKRTRILMYAGFNPLIITPKIDDRHGHEKIQSRSGVSIKTFKAGNTEDIKKMFDPSKHNALIIDEGQFFDDALVDYVDELANNGVRVIISGLDQNFLRKPFGIMPKLFAIAENITKLAAVCLVCKNAASCSFRKIKSLQEVQIGDIDEYEARCRSCHAKGIKEQAK